MLSLFAIVVPPIVQWAVTNATISGTTRAACGDVGACWTFIKVRFDLFFYGLYPSVERWRVHAALLLLIVSTVLTLKAPARYQGLAGAVLLTVVPIAGGVLLVGGVLGLRYVPTNAWGGLMLNVLLTLVAGVGGFLLGIILAFGSPLEAARCPMGVGVLHRAVAGRAAVHRAVHGDAAGAAVHAARSDRRQSVRAMLALTLFTGAYMAEIVRGGLQAIPLGQVEAATALGLRPWKVQLFIVLPQALRLVIPGVANTVIDLFKDTTLVSIVGLFDLLGVVNQAQRDQAWLGMSREGYAFAGAVFFLSCFLMSMLSRMAEQQRRDKVNHRE